LSRRVGFWVSSAVVVVLLASLVGCGGDDDDNDNGDRERRPTAVAGTFVGKLRGSEEFVAVVAAPPAKGQDRREVSAFVCDARRLCAWFSGAASGSDVVAKSDDGEAETKVKLSAKAATGSVELPEGKTARYTAREATATAGLYDLTVSRRGKVSGASAAGVGLTGSLTVPPPGNGRIKLADGTRLRFEVTESTAGDSAQLRAGQLRLIVLPDGQVRGAGKSRGGDGGSDFFVRSTSK
jgi:hypothetical protein